MIAIPLIFINLDQTITYHDYSYLVKVTSEVWKKRLDYQHLHHQIYRKMQSFANIMNFFLRNFCIDISILYEVKGHNDMSITYKKKGLNLNSHSLFFVQQFIVLA